MTIDPSPLSRFLSCFLSFRWGRPAALPVPDLHQGGSVNFCGLGYTGWVSMGNKKIKLKGGRTLAGLHLEREHPVLVS